VKTFKKSQQVPQINSDSEADAREILKQISVLGINPPPEISAIMNTPAGPAMLNEWWKKYKGGMDTMQEVVKDHSQVVNNKAVEFQRNLPDAMDAARSQQEAVQAVASSKVFNLKKAQVGVGPIPPAPVDTGVADMGIGADQGMGVDPGMNANGLSFASIIDLVTFLDSSDLSNARAQLLSLVDEENQQNVADILDQYYQKDWSTVDDAETKKINSRGMKFIWNVLVPAAKADQAQMGVIENAPFKPAEIAAFVEDVNNTIKKLAQDSVQKSKAYNLKKESQAKTTENVIMFGPGEKRFDAFLRQPISDWHIVERNKGFGLVVDDAWNLDWEAIWRGNVMDKYSRPYRDTKTGKWIGGYIQKRFEVDKWIPEQNNLQLLPGQLRKPIIPERGITEARLEAMRKKEGKEKGFEPDSKGEPYDWNEQPGFAPIKLSSVKKFNLKKAQLAQTPNDSPFIYTKNPQEKKEYWEQEKTRIMGDMKNLEEGIKSRSQFADTYDKGAIRYYERLKRGLIEQLKDIERYIADPVSAPMPAVKPSDFRNFGEKTAEILKKKVK
jgi:hypothetical protein